MNTAFFDQLIPGCSNFYWREVFKTTHNETLLRQEFLNLPTETREIITRNIIAVANRLQTARNVLGFSIPVSSWWRSPRVERLVGGSGTNHYWGDAVDPQLCGTELTRFIKFFKDHDGGLGVGQTQAHIDLGYGAMKGNHARKRRWTY